MLLVGRNLEKKLITMIFPFHIMAFINLVSVVKLHLITNPKEFLEQFPAAKNNSYH